ncbi:hypothetical protein K2173_017844 [Erythroxylum novogranatense]|uniref:Uncharacterized protein n=1 Tax=Erythroxylum novogranatense TaxID=1862640 RepID=A0AAV8SLX0_9ROSI|nr:hypothetical protein K2173_017844 [Erythroxylum novogranatense]
MAFGAVDMMLQCVFDGSISMHNLGIERRPYHRNCKCELHRSKGTCSNACPKKRNVSFRKKLKWNDRSMCMKASGFSSQSLVLGDSSVAKGTSADGDASHR